MRAVVQRASEGSVVVGDTVVAAIGAGLVVLLGVAADDTSGHAERMAAKVARLRVFEDDEGRLDRSLAETGGEALVVSQFTLVADTRKGNRPSFTHAARPEVAEPLYEAFCTALEQEGVRVARGIFGARMRIGLVNDGPVTVVVDL